MDLRAWLASTASTSEHVEEVSFPRKWASRTTGHLAPSRGGMPKSAADILTKMMCMTTFGAAFSVTNDLLFYPMGNRVQTGN